ncbi:Variable large protein [Staphylococcus argensis]
MELIGKVIAFVMETISNWLGSSELFKDVKNGMKREDK